MSHAVINIEADVMGLNHDLLTLMCMYAKFNAKLIQISHGIN